MMLNAQLENLINYINDGEIMVFWTDHPHYHRLKNYTEQTDDEMIVFLEDGGHIDLYNIDFNDIKVFKSVDWFI